MATLTPRKDSALPMDDVELLAQILRDCHLHDASAPDEASRPVHQSTMLPCGGFPTHQPPADDVELLAQMLRDRHLHDAPVRSAQSISAPQSPIAPVEQWADEMTRQMSGSASVEEARAKLVALLGVFQASAEQPERLHALQGANRVLLQGFRQLHARSRVLDAERRRAEETSAQLAAELARCQEALRASERAKGMLQYHIQLMDLRPPGIAAGGM